MSSFDHKSIEKNWLKVWKNKKLFSPNLEKDNKPFYNLMMFPYPSAEGLHVGNMYAFTGSDVYGRMKRMQGYSVFEPIGLDGFGIHSENYAIKVNKNPKEQAKISQKNFYRQLEVTGNAYDWERTLETYESEYYKWTQWIFIQLFKKGLAYRSKSPVNFCPSCKTVLADEQVIDGKCERCSNVVEKKELEQWFFKITEYADRLLKGLAKIDWSERVKVAQKNWIGKKEGIDITYEIESQRNFVIIHGYTGSPQGDFHPWLKRELESRGHKVTIPKLPNTDDPDVNVQAEYALKNAKFDENTVLVGHSLGTAVALKVAEKLDKPLKKLVLAAAFAQPGFLDHSRPFENKFDWKFNFEKIKQNTSSVVLLRAKNDSAVPQERSEYIQSFLGGRIVDFEATNDHVTGETEPVVLENCLEQLTCWTSRPDTNFGATFVVLAPEHPQVLEVTKPEYKKEVEKYIKLSQSKSDEYRLAEGKDKTGAFTGSYAVNKLTEEKMPIWVSDFVLMDFGTGAVVGVPGHDRRDFEFAAKFKLPIRRVVVGKDQDESAIEKIEQVVDEEGKIVNSDFLNGTETERAKEKITDFLEDKGWGKRKTSFHLRDWLISRQRYWGPPIPMIDCKKCGWVPEDEKNLPVILPDVSDWKPLGTGKSPLASVESFVKTNCPNCGGEARRETDVSDTFLDSAWYFLRYTSVNDSKRAWSPETIKKWLPVDMYIGGAEHSVLHLLYTRFLTMVFKDLDLLSFEEPFAKFRAHGLLISEGAKMSKSKGNVVVPDDYIEKYGSDTLRCYLMFCGRYEQGGDFQDKGIEGISRFLNRVWNLLNGANLVKEEISRDDLHIMHKTIEQVTVDIENLDFNTAISALMIWSNYLSKKKTILKVEAENFLKLLAPFAPFITEELWSQIDPKSRSIHFEPWSKYDPKLVESDEIKLVVQVNGRVRDTLNCTKGVSETEAKKKALTSENVQKHIGRKKYKVIYIKDKLINFVLY